MRDYDGCAPGGHESRAGDIVRQAELFAENVERWHEKVVAEDVEADEHVGHEDRRACGGKRARASMFEGGGPNDGGEGMAVRK